MSDDDATRDEQSGEVPWGEMGRGVPAGLGSGDLGDEGDVPDEAAADPDTPAEPAPDAPAPGDDE